MSEIMICRFLMSVVLVAACGASHGPEDVRLTNPRTRHTAFLLGACEGVTLEAVIAHLPTTA